MHAPLPLLPSPIYRYVVGNRLRVINSVTFSDLINLRELWVVNCVCMEVALHSSPLLVYQWCVQASDVVVTIMCTWQQPVFLYHFRLWLLYSLACRYAPGNGLEVIERGSFFRLRFLQTLLVCVCVCLHACVRDRVWMWVWVGCVCVSVTVCVIVLFVLIMPQFRLAFSLCVCTGYCPRTTCRSWPPMCLMGWIRCRSCTLKVHVSVHTYMCVCVHVCTTDYRQEDYMLCYVHT